MKNFALEVFSMLFAAGVVVIVVAAPFVALALVLRALSRLGRRVTRSLRQRRDGRRLLRLRQRSPFGMTLGGNLATRAMQSRPGRYAMALGTLVPQETTGPLLVASVESSVAAMLGGPQGRRAEVRRVLSQFMTSIACDGALSFHRQVELAWESVFALPELERLADAVRDIHAFHAKRAQLRAAELAIAVNLCDELYLEAESRVHRGKKKTSIDEPELASRRPSLRRWGGARAERALAIIVPDEPVAAAGVKGGKPPRQVGAGGAFALRLRQQAIADKADIKMHDPSLWKVIREFSRLLQVVGAVRYAQDLRKAYARIYTVRELDILADLATDVAQVDQRIGRVELRVAQAALAIVDRCMEFAAGQAGAHAVSPSSLVAALGDLEGVTERAYRPWAREPRRDAPLDGFGRSTYRGDDGSDEALPSAGGFSILSSRFEDPSES